ncbi:serine/threonine-protein kinase [Blastopirellula marina]|uniref:Serine/threonine protein kinase n=1 Tax=Blastopirellula marina TaxID=124 RepID=A0A2S8GPX3_9BACT|nr:serine/threonine-protein kinase [Blastopirellula marina]PQO46477.1 serine/threonine protein kinase [Blastopirellula marina]
MSLLKKFTSFFAGQPKLDISSRFEILREAVSGTMSDFYKVREHSSGRILGLKILDLEKQQFFDSRFVGLSRPKEGDIAMSMQHPCIVRTLEHGMVTTGQQYVLMEFLEGRGLNSLIIDQDPMLEGKQLILLRQMADALVCVHEAGYIHRDICPRNFIAAPDCRSCKLIDFGLTLPAKPEFMGPGNRTGTPNYMAPEIVRRRPTDQRVDIFSLGVTAFRLLAYELPWASVEGTGRDALTHDTMAPSNILEKRPGLNPELGDLVMSCIEKDPRGRPQSASELLASLQRIKKMEA